MVFVLALILPLVSFDVNSSNFPGDREFACRDYPLAVAAYEAFLASTGDSAAVLWRLARVEICTGDVAEDAASEAHYRKAEHLAQIAVRLDSMNSDAHTWLAVALGGIAVFEGSKSKVRMSNEIKYHLDRAINLNPNNDVAYSVLGSFFTAIGGISWFERQLARIFFGRLPDGGYEEAESAFKRATALAPTVVRHHYALGLLYNSLGRDAEARREFEYAMSLPIVLARDVTDQRTAREILSAME